jgi:hypothetical protein
MYRPGAAPGPVRLGGMVNDHKDDDQHPQYVDEDQPFRLALCTDVRRVAERD